MKELLDLLKEIRPSIDFENEKKLIDDGVLDSFDIITIVSEINAVFDLEISVADLEAENLNNAEAMYTLIEKHQGIKKG